LEKIQKKIDGKIQKYKDLNNDTHIDFDVPIINNSFIDVKQLDVSNINKDLANYLSNMYLSHRFDLLGSGWVKNSYDSEALGVEGYKYNEELKIENGEFNYEKLLLKPHQQKVKQIYSLILNYSPIDWQKDYKSGYRWDIKKWYKEQRYGLKPGVDIKVPWELARIQHLPQLAIFALVDKNLKKNNILEFKNQILDFIAFNPPRMGVNWVCTMDVGIRAANILVAYDMFTQIDSFGILDDNFKQIFTNSIYEHGLHIINNLEYSEWLTSNHYLSDIVGLLFVGAYLNKEEWISFAIQEVINEMEKEFYEDGGNFESSTSYHRLSGELMIYATALILRLIKDKKIKKINYKIKNQKLKTTINHQPSTINQLPQCYIDRLYKIGRFTVDITKPNGEIPQFGDNDSGRFFRLSPNGKFLTNKEAEDKYLNLKGYNLILNSQFSILNSQLYWDENILNHKTFISAMNGLYDESIFKTNFNLEKSFIETLSGGIKLKVKDKSYKKVEIKKPSFNIKELKFTNTKKYKFSILNSQFSIINYPDSGICIFKSDNFYLSICATPLGQKNSGGHTHNDKLSYELWINGKDIVKDSGTYLYTPLPHRRNEFRSIKAHNVPIVKDIEQNNWSEGGIGLFGMFNESKCFVSNYGNNFIELVLEYKDIKVVRRFEIKEDVLEVIDMCNKEFEYSKFEMYSNGYGKIIQ
jgi:hypothetical protein